MAANDAPYVSYGSVGTAAEVSHLTTKVKQIAITNTSTTVSLYVKVSSSPVSADAAAAQAAIDVAVAAADDNFLVPPGERRIVYKSAKPQFVACSVIGSATGPTVYENCGTVWYD